VALRILGDSGARKFIIVRKERGQCCFKVSGESGGRAA
jgi:hypothetical protein